MASIIEVTQDVVYELSGERGIMPADSIVQSPSELVEAPGFKGGGEIYASLFTGTTQAGGGAYGASRQITVSQLQPTTLSSWWSALTVSRLSKVWRLRSFKSITKTMCVELDWWLS